MQPSWHTKLDNCNPADLPHRTGTSRENPFTLCGVTSVADMIDRCRLADVQCLVGAAELTGTSEVWKESESFEKLMSL